MADGSITDYKQGYDEEFLDDNHREYECPICHLPYREPIQLKECGHRFCRDCIMRNCRQRGSICPLDQGKFTRDTMFEDKACRRTVLSMKVKCKEFESGCFWTGELGDIENHRVTCPAQMVECPNRGCNLTIRQRYLVFHQHELCSWRLVDCVFCSTPYPHAEEQLHNDQCAKFPIMCSQCKEKGIAREKMSLHTQDECGETTVSCPYVKIGCTFKDKRHCIQSHVDTEINHHLSQACEKIIKLETRLVLQDQRIQSQEQLIHSLRNNKPPEPNAGLCHIIGSDSVCE